MDNDIELSAKLLDGGVVDLLLSLGIEKEIIRKYQQQYIYETTLEELENIVDNFKRKRFDKIDIDLSQAGDIGQDNYYLTLSCGEDIGDILEKLKDFK